MGHTPCAGTRTLLTALPVTTESCHFRARRPTTPRKSRSNS